MSSSDLSRLPIQHPHYRYPASRNPYWAKVRVLQGRVFSDNETEAFAGRWLTRFPGRSMVQPELRRRELHVEIGCNAGHVVGEWALRNPHRAYIGIDWKFKPIFRAAEKADRRNIDNMIFFRAHAERLPFMFGPGEVDSLYLYFPDPWPRKSQWKNRFITAERLAGIAPVLKKGGIFHIKTDHPGYFEWMENAISQVADLWEVQDRTTDLHANHPDPRSLQIPEVTLFERLFIQQGIPIQSIRLVRR